jgi:hypothetical protein
MNALRIRMNYVRDKVGNLGNKIIGRKPGNENQAAPIISPPPVEMEPIQSQPANVEAPINTPNDNNDDNNIIDKEAEIERTEQEIARLEAEYDTIGKECFRLGENTATMVMATSCDKEKDKIGQKLKQAKAYLVKLQSPPPSQGGKRRRTKKGRATKKRVSKKSKKTRKAKRAGRKSK